MAAVLLAAATGGCLHRELRITSEPPGALVWVSDLEIGRTPVTVPFTWYGDYRITVRRDGYRTLKTHADIDPPVHEFCPLDLFSELAPWTYHDRRYLHYVLEKLDEPATQAEDELIRRADALHEENLKPVR
jgi:hypothetical protein